MPDQEPPEDIAARLFFEEWLPAAFAREFGGTRRSNDVEVRVILDGEGGGAWDLRVRRGQLLVEPARNEELAVMVRQSVQDWRATLFAEAGTFALRPPRGSPLDILFVDSELRALVEQLRGLLRLEVSNYNGRTWALQMKFGKHAAPDSPDAVVSMTAETYRQLKEKTLLPPQAYFAGLVNIEGNAGLAMQMAMAILPRFTG